MTEYGFLALILAVVSIGSLIGSAVGVYLAERK